MIEAPDTVASSINRQLHEINRLIKDNFENHPLVDSVSYNVMMQNIRKLTEETQSLIVKEIINKDILVEK